MPKTIPMSVRVSVEDASFLAGLQIEGAVTPSEKMRALIARERRRQEGAWAYTTRLALLQEMVAPVLQRVLEAENDHQVHSELVRFMGEWLPEALAWMLTSEGLDEGEGARDGRPDLERAELERLERGLLDRSFSLLETILRYGVTEQAPCYNLGAVSSRLGPALELAQVIHNRTGKEN